MRSTGAAAAQLRLGYGGYLASHPKALSQLRDRLEELIRTGFIRPPIGSVHRLEDGEDALRELAERSAERAMTIEPIPVP